MSRTQPRILIADDDPAILNMLAIRLGKQNYEVLVASDGNQTLEQARMHQPDLVLLDLMMPGKSGLQVAKELRADEQLHTIGIVMISAIGETWNAMTSLVYGADACVDKPFDFGELDAKIRTVLQERAKPPPAAG
jgi:DNA-binding response OmpR family regulator